MNAVDDRSAQTPPRRTQCSLAAVFYLTTGTALALSLTVWQRECGAAAAVVVVGAFWTALARRAARRRLAYHLASGVLGVLGGVVLAIPLSLCVGNGAGAVRWVPNGIAVWSLLLSVSSTVAAWILRRQIREDSIETAGVCTLYVTAMISGMLVGVDFLIGQLMWPDVIPAPKLAVADFFLAPFGNLLYGVLAATVTAPIMLPMAMALCAVLRWLDPPEFPRAESDGPRHFAETE